MSPWAGGWPSAAALIGSDLALRDSRDRKQGNGRVRGYFFFECGPTGGIFRFFDRKPLLGHNSGKFVENHSQIPYFILRFLISEESFSP